MDKGDIFINEQDIYNVIQTAILYEDDNTGETELERLFKSTIFYDQSDSEKFYQAMSQGMIFALILISSKCKKYWKQETEAI